MEINPLLLVKGSSQPAYAEGMDVQPFINPRGDQLVAQSLPPLTELARLGNSYWASTTTAAAPVTSIPTTAALLVLQNGEAASGKSYVIDSVFVVQVAVTAAVQNVGILVNNAFDLGAISRIAGSQTPRNLRGGQVYRGTGRVSVGQSLDATNGIAANWMPLGNTPSASNTLQIGTVVDYDCKGRIIVPPGGQLALSALAGAATASSIQIGVRWHEVLLPPVI